MAQKLILPINKCKLTASMKTEAYQKRFGYVHYGVDLVGTSGDRTVYASGTGTVVAVGQDNVVGNVVAVAYRNAHNRVTGKAQDVVFRYFHLDSIAVETGQEVNKDTKLGVYSNTGQLSTGPHLHLEADTDIEHPLHSPTVSSSNYLQGRQAGASDRTMGNPLHWLHCKSSAPDSQTYTTAGDAYIAAEDYAIQDFDREVVVPSPPQFQGIDVSRHNGPVDWAAVKAAGKDFAFIRVGWAGWNGGITSNKGLDARFLENMRGALDAGLRVGVYVYAYCKTPAAARAAAREVIELVKPYPLTYPIAFDIEDTSDSGTRYDKMTKVENTAIVRAFLEVIREAGYTGMVYTYKSFAENHLDMEALAEWDAWIAHYAPTCGYKGKHTIWQYKGDVKGFVGSCPGVTGACDLNVSYKDYAALCGDPQDDRLNTLLALYEGAVAQIQGVLDALGQLVQ